MKMPRLLALALAILSAPSAQAATTFVSAVLDRPYVFPGPADRFPTYYTQLLTPRFAFNPGDTLDMTLIFPGGAPLNLGFLPSSVFFTVFGGSSAFTGTRYTSTGTFGFIDPTMSLYESRHLESAVYCGACMSESGGKLPFRLDGRAMEGKRESRRAAF